MEYLRWEFEKRSFNWEVKSQSKSERGKSAAMACFPVSYYGEQVGSKPAKDSQPPFKRTEGGYYALVVILIHTSEWKLTQSWGSRQSCWS